MVWYELESRLGRFLQIRDSEPPTGCPTNEYTVFASNRHIQLVVPYRKCCIVSCAPRYTSLKSSLGGAYKVKAYSQERFRKWELS